MNTPVSSAYGTPSPENRKPRRRASDMMPSDTSAMPAKPNGVGRSPSAANASTETSSGDRPRAIG